MTAIKQDVEFKPELGKVQWFCSDEDSGPDVGKSLTLPDGSCLYFGEISNRTLEDHGINPEGVSWAIVHYGKRAKTIIGQCFSVTTSETDAIEDLAQAMITPTGATHD